MKKHIFLGDSLYNQSKWNSDIAFPSSLSRYGEVIYIPSNFTILRSLFKVKDEKRILYNYLFKGKKEENISDFLKICYMPPLFHIGQAKSSFFKIKESIYEIEFTRLVNNIKNICKSKNYSEAIIWSTSLHTHMLREVFPYNKIIYYVVDDLRYYSHKDYDFVEKNEIKNAKKCDHVVTISENLTKRFKRYNANVIESSIGITTCDHELKEIPAIRELGNTLIGFIGNLANHVDYGLLQSIVDTFSHSKLIIVGPLEKNVSELAKNGLNNRKNILCIDSVNIQRLFDILYSLDVCILPFKINKITEASDPMKMYDYIHSSKPIVAVKVNENMVRFAPFSFLCKERIDFITYLDKILKKNYISASAKERNAFLDSHSWDSIVGDILKTIS